MYNPHHFLTFEVVIKNTQALMIDNAIEDFRKELKTFHILVLFESYYTICISHQMELVLQACKLFLRL